jgi:Hemerythrin HHE cation binding domain
MTDGSRVTDLIRKDHAWFRRQFSTLEEAHGDTPKAEGLWADLAARLEVHAAAEEALFYPRLLRDDKDAVDDTKDAIGDHNQIRDAIRKAEASHIGDSGW